MFHVYNTLLKKKQPVDYVAYSEKNVALSWKQVDIYLPNTMLALLSSKLIGKIFIVINFNFTKRKETDQ